MRYSTCCCCCCLVAKSCLTLCDPMDCSPPGSSVHGISQARILERVAVFLLQGIFLIQSSNSRIGRRVLYHGAAWVAPCFTYLFHTSLQNAASHFRRVACKEPGTTVASGLCIGQRGSQERGGTGGRWSCGHVADSLCSFLFHRPRLLPFLDFVCRIPWSP